MMQPTLKDQGVDVDSANVAESKPLAADVIKHHWNQIQSQVDLLASEISAENNGGDTKGFVTKHQMMEALQELGIPKLMATPLANTAVQRHEHSRWC